MQYVKAQKKTKTATEIVKFALDNGTLVPEHTPVHVVRMTKDGVKQIDEIVEVSKLADRLYNAGQAHAGSVKLWDDIREANVGNIATLFKSVKNSLANQVVLVTSNGQNVVTITRRSGKMSPCNVNAEQIAKVCEYIRAHPESVPASLYKLAECEIETRPTGAPSFVYECITDNLED